MAKTAKSTTEASIDVRKIVLDDKLYPRAELREKVVNDYAQLIARRHSPAPDRRLPGQIGVPPGRRP